MPSLKVLHTADLHFSNKADKLAEVVTTSDFLLAHARMYAPDVAVLAGDTVDEHDGEIKIDSAAARAAIRFVNSLAEICPVVIIRGTRSHDRETPYIFRECQRGHSVYVGTNIEQVALTQDGRFIPVDEESLYMTDGCKAVFTLLPSPDKASLIAGSGVRSLLSGNMIARETMHDVLTYLGEVNSQVSEEIPRILVGHGMITGSVYSSGSVATGEDFEYSINDLNQTATTLKAFGHVHKQQSFAGNIHYSGSVGRLNKGETEEKGFLLHEFDDGRLMSTAFVETPARRFALHEVLWDGGGIDAIVAEVGAIERGCAGADVRFRYTIPEELRHMINRNDVSKRLLAAGARQVQIEMTVIPAVRQRAPGISQADNMPEKFSMLASANGQAFPPRVVDLSGTIERRSVEELIEDARRTVRERLAELRMAADTCVEERCVIPPVGGSADSYQDGNTEQMALFGAI